MPHASHPTMAMKLKSYMWCLIQVEAMVKNAGQKMKLPLAPNAASWGLEEGFQSAIHLLVSSALDILENLLASGHPEQRRRLGKAIAIHDLAEV